MLAVLIDCIFMIVFYIVCIFASVFNCLIFLQLRNTLLLIIYEINLDLNWAGLVASLMMNK